MILEFDIHFHPFRRAAIMQFALPPRKSSHPPPYARSPRSSLYRRKRLKTGAAIACGAVAFLYILLRLLSSSSSSTIEIIPAGTPEVVIVTLLDPALGKEYIAKIKENRDDYASRHGMEEGIRYITTDPS